MCVYSSMQCCLQLTLLARHISGVDEQSALFTPWSVWRYWT